MDVHRAGCSFLLRATLKAYTHAGTPPFVGTLIKCDLQRVHIRGACTYAGRPRRDRANTTGARCIRVLVRFFFSASSNAAGRYDTSPTRTPPRLPPTPSSKPTIAGDGEGGRERLAETIPVACPYRRRRRLTSSSPHGDALLYRCTVPRTRVCAIAKGVRYGRARVYARCCGARVTWGVRRACCSCL